MKIRTKICWVSRHEPLKAQKQELKKKFRDFELIQISKTFRNARDILKDVKEKSCEVAVVVAPLSMIAELTKDKSITWLWSEMTPLGESKFPPPDFQPDRDVWLPSKESEVGRHLRFKEFRKILKVEMKTEKLKR